MVVDAQLFVSHSSSVVVMTAELCSSVIVQLFEVEPVNRPLGHTHVISDNFMLSHKMFALNAPSYCSRNASHFANDRRLVVNSVFLRTHLVCKEALIGRLVDSRFRIFNCFL